MGTRLEYESGFPQWTAAVEIACFQRAYALRDQAIETANLLDVRAFHLSDFSQITVKRKTYLPFQNVRNGSRPAEHLTCQTEASALPCLAPESRPSASGQHRTSC